MTVRVHYAPSPTGDPHLGITRVALFNWLMARRHGGRFILRVDDTDRSRLVDGALEQILEGLRWVGLHWDEGPGVGGPFGPYRQSRRLAGYHEAAERLLAAGHAYPCYCASSDATDAAARAARREACRCRALSPAERRMRTTAYAVRFAAPREGTTRVVDHVRGEIRTRNEQIEDFVLLRSDGFPTYHLAGVVDDALMEITHVIRSEYSLASTPRHVLLHQALGSTPPVFAHLGALLNGDGSVMSARSGAPGLLELRERGYLPDALVECLARPEPAAKGEGPASRDALVAAFTLDRLPRAPARLDPDRLARTNGAHLRALPADDLVSMLVLHLERGLPAEVPRPLDLDYVRAAVPVVRERLRLLSDVGDLAGFFFMPPARHDDALLAGGLSAADAGAVLDASAHALEALEAFSAPAIEEALRRQASLLALPARSFFHPLRVALAGRADAPPLFDAIEVLGRTRTLERLRVAADRLSRPAVVPSGAAGDPVAQARAPDAGEHPAPA